MAQHLDVEGVCCPLCGTSLCQFVKVGRFYDLLSDSRLIAHMVCAEQIEGMRLLDRVVPVSSGAAEVRWRYRF